MAPQIRALSAELQEAAKQQVFEVPERIESDLEAMKTWIAQQPHLKARTDDQFLITFLRGCKYSLERAKSKLDRYYTLRTKYPEHFCTFDVDAPRFREILKLGVFLVLPRPINDNGPRLVILRLARYPPEKYNFPEILAMMNSLQDMMFLEDDYASIYGCTFIMDLKNATASHLFQMTPSLAKKMTVFSEEALPYRPKGSHFLNTIAGFEQIFNMFKPMLSKKQQGRLFVHGNKLELLTAQIPLEYLPKEYGGENGTAEEIINYWDKKFDEYRDYFKDNKNYGTDEKLRPGKPIDFSGLFGIEGSFRKLDVD